MLTSQTPYQSLVVCRNESQGSIALPHLSWGKDGPSLWPDHVTPFHSRTVSYSLP